MHEDYFRKKKLLNGEKLVASMRGWIGSMLGSGDNKQHHGVLVLTNQRIAFVRWGVFSEVFEAIPLGKLASVEIRSFLGYRVASLHAPNDELVFKTFAPKDEFTSFVRKLESCRSKLAAGFSPIPTNTNLVSELERLAELRNRGTLSDEEFVFAKSHLLHRGTTDQRKGRDTNGPRAEIGNEKARAPKASGRSVGQWTVGAGLVFGLILWSTFGGDREVSQAAAVKRAPAPVRAVSLEKSAESVSQKKQVAWSDLAICSAGVHTYFWLKAVPRHLSSEGSKHDFQSAAGHIYTCHIAGDRAILTWINGDGQSMRSEKTRFWVDNAGVLHVQDQMLKETFDQQGKPWRHLTRDYL